MARKPASKLDSSVKITLDGEEYTLRPTIKAALAIEAEIGGLQRTIEALQAKPITTMAFLIKAGLTRESALHMQEAAIEPAEIIWRDGQNAFIDPVIQFAMRTFNSGKDFDDEPVQDDAGNDPLHV